MSSQSLKENLYDGDSLDMSIEDAERNIGIEIRDIYADKGYKKREENQLGTKGTISKGQNLYISGLKQCGKDKKKMKRRSLIEARISEIKRCGGGSKNYLHGVKGDMMNATLCGLGQNVRIILRYYKRKRKKVKVAS